MHVSYYIKVVSDGSRNVLKIATLSLQGSYAIQKLVKEFCSLRLTDMLWSGQADEQTLNNLINMPQMIGNRLQLDLDKFFIPKAFYATLIAIVCEVLARCHTAISTGSRDCSLIHISHLVSKVATSGYHGNPDCNSVCYVVICNNRYIGSHDHLFRYCYCKGYDMAEDILCSHHSTLSICCR